MLRSENFLLSQFRIQANQNSRFNSTIAMHRRQNLDGVYNVHTNFMQYPKIMQPTHVRWEQLPLVSPNSHSSQDGLSDQRALIGHQTAQLNEGVNDSKATTLFSQIPDVYTRKFMVTDTIYETPPNSTLGYPGPDEAFVDIDPVGLTHVPEDVLAELPSDCKEEFYKTLAQEVEWKGRWSTEDGARRELKITYNV